jgi:hypothetical protein
MKNNRLYLILAIAALAAAALVAVAVGSRLG